MQVKKAAILNTLRKGFVASCQPVDDGPMDKPEIVTAMAMASVMGGAVALRIEGVENLRAVRPHVDVPIIGIVKRDLDDSPIRITPYLKDVQALHEAGADIIAIDASDRARPVTIDTLVAEIHKLGRLAMADSSSYIEGMYAKQLGVEIIGSTLSGYTGGVIPEEPDFELVERLKQSGCFVMAEGRYNSPELAQRAIESGADCVTVGSAITRIEHICSWFGTAVSAGRHEAMEKSA
ncbi:N-acetylmannosamine-6-phosphate 2-epimerase [Vibrio lentus]|uniref:N-acetylmannosamine-6-phosphate 2-epimerase n=1 Tax=Vibrio lentus TaxID=136468 RepID=UPI0007EEECF1|nr:N-acetylmannosamine-6-phosphate 2-epimerase [Vibrio lentus]MDN3629341.1 N-acetylmannosamine-6-phosphate 2-epimerase [Vibrio lentus]OBS99952.1 N-acetylmannosamine-6-phosphate 2-epimerase [Vibrio tasmaniensis]